MEADRYGMGPEIRSLCLAASLSLTSSLKVCHLWTLSQERLQRLKPAKVATIREEEHGQDEEEEEEEEEVEEEEEEEWPNTVGARPPGQTSPATSAGSGSKMTVSSTPLQQGVPPVDPNLGEWNCYERDLPAYFATKPEPQDGHPDDYKEHHKLLTRVIGNVVNRSPNSSWLFLPCLHAIADLFPCPEGMELRVPLSVYNKRHSGQDLAKTLKTIFLSFCRKTCRVPEKGKLVVWLDIVTTPGHFACGVWQSRDGALVAPVFIYDSCVPVKVPTRTNPYPALATFFLWKFFVKMPVPSQSVVIELPKLLIGDDDVDIMAKVWAPFFDCAHISENTSFSAAGRSEVFHPHLQGKLTRFPIEFFPLTTNSACFTEGNVAQTVRHFGFSETAANKIAWALDMVPTKVLSQTAANGVRKLWVRALPDPVNEHAYADRKRALQDSNGSQGAWSEASWQHAVESVLFVECQSKTVRHCGYSIRNVREWHNDNEMRRGIQHIKNQRFTKSTNTCQPCRAASLSPTLLVDDRYYQIVAAPRQAGGSSKPASPPPPPGSGGDGSQTGAARGLLELRAATRPPPSKLGPSETAKPPNLCDRVADLGDRLVEARLAGSMGEEKAWTFIGGGRKQLHLMSGPDDLRLHGRGGDESTWEVAAASPLGVVPWLEHNRPEVLAELRKVRNLCTGRLAQSKSLVPLGVADARYRTEVCQGIEDAATYSRPGLAFLLPAEDVHASPPKGGVNPAFATGCPRCKDLAGVNPCFRIFQSLHPNTGAMMPGPEWQILSYHVPGMSFFLPEVDDEDEARRRMYETARTMAVAKEMRHWNPEAHVGDDEYILEDFKAAVDEATAGKTNEQEMRRVERINREGRVFLSDVNPSCVSHFVADALSPETHDKAAAMCKEPFVVVTSPWFTHLDLLLPLMAASKADIRCRGANAPRPGAAGRQRAAAGGSGAPTRGGRGSGAPTRGGRGSAAPTRGGRGSAAPTVTAHPSKHMSK
eukprot:jgi/Tetstr1/435347/TSEL_024265.t1